MVGRLVLQSKMDGRSNSKNYKWGSTWIQQTISICDMLNGVCFTDVNNGWAVGYEYISYPAGIILRTTNGGATWNQQTSGTQQNIQVVSFSNSSKGVVVGSNGTILNTVDGGMFGLAHHQVIQIIFTDYVL